MTRYILLAVFALAACAPTRAPAPENAGPDVPEGPFNVILYIGDGAGLSYWSAAMLSASELAVQSLPVVGLIDTQSADSKITDSAAGATAYATGLRTFNGAIGVGPDTVARRTVLELAESKGMATGLVATSTLTHATPASFAAHVPSRNMHWEIAEHMAERGVDVLLGGGRRYFDPTERPDSQNLVARVTRDAVYVQSQDELLAVDPDTVSALVGFFADNNPGPATGRTPSLPVMTDAALKVLEKDPDGFFLMVEGSQIDWRGHDNAPLREVVAEVMDFDMAIRQGVMFQARHPNTLILVLADHSTGGLALHADDTGVFRAHYTTEGHTADLVPLFAGGPGAGAFGGIIRNDRVGRLLLEMVAEGGAGTIGAGAITSSAPSQWNPSSH